MMIRNCHDDFARCNELVRIVLFRIYCLYLCMLLRPFNICDIVPVSNYNESNGTMIRLMNLRSRNDQNGTIQS